eukprot:scaffold47723_cov80-Phaeocystis_antarctica.AAC.6
MAVVGASGCFTTRATSAAICSGPAFLGSSRPPMRSWPPMRTASGGAGCGGDKNLTLGVSSKYGRRLTACAPVSTGVRSVATASSSTCSSIKPRLPQPTCV